VKLPTLSFSFSRRTFEGPVTTFSSLLSNDDIFPPTWWNTFLRAGPPSLPVLVCCKFLKKFVPSLFLSPVISSDFFYTPCLSFFPLFWALLLPSELQAPSYSPFFLSMQLVLSTPDVTTLIDIAVSSPIAPSFFLSLEYSRRVQRPPLQAEPRGLVFRLLFGLLHWSAPLLLINGGFCPSAVRFFLPTKSDFFDPPFLLYLATFYYPAFSLESMSTRCHFNLVGFNLLSFLYSD